MYVKGKYKQLRYDKEIRNNLFMQVRNKEELIDSALLLFIRNVKIVLNCLQEKSSFDRENAQTKEMILF